MKSVLIGVGLALCAGATAQAQSYPFSGRNLVPSDSRVFTAYRPIKATPVELDRASRAAALMNGGRCYDAQSLADREHDTALALRIQQLCHGFWQDSPSSVAW